MKIFSIYAIKCIFSIITEIIHIDQNKLILNKSNDLIFNNCKYSLFNAVKTCKIL